MSGTYHVYFLMSLKDGKFYTGQTTDLKSRLAQHNRGRVRSTKARLPFKLVYWESLETRSAAMKRERKLKSLKHADKLKLVKVFERGKIG
ncbi:MAG: GIY-YIG nuclease family protein [Hadesarchaea archaeon]|nr:GIY-YIG nuclease family protein [Hadesarchaea archaeon]MDH5685949.1 GIY-YIG nuclease family protein [Hadesarchaea archaeon]